MLDGCLRPFIDPPLTRAGQILAGLGVSANGMTIIGFAFGTIACLFTAFGFYEWGLCFLVLNRLSDGLDGGIARIRGLTDFGGFLDILCDFIVYAGIIFSFALADARNTFAAAFLIFSFIGPITSFLAYAIIAAKNKVVTAHRGKKSFYYLGGLCEGTETFLTLVLLCLFPDYFSYIAITYGVLCWITTAGRSFQAWQDFR